MQRRLSTAAPEDDAAVALAGAAALAAGADGVDSRVCAVGAGGALPEPVIGVRGDEDAPGAPADRTARAVEGWMQRLLAIVCSERSPCVAEKGVDVSAIVRYYWKCRSINREQK